MRPGLAPKPSGAVGVARPSFSSGCISDQLGSLRNVDGLQQLLAVGVGRERRVGQHESTGAVRRRSMRDLGRGVDEGPRRDAGALGELAQDRLAHVEAGARELDLLGLGDRRARPASRRRGRRRRQQGRRLISMSCLLQVIRQTASIAAWPRRPKVQSVDGDQGKERGRGADGVDLGVSCRSSWAMMASGRVASAPVVNMLRGELVVGEREAEQAGADHARQHERQGDATEGAEPATAPERERRLLEPACRSG